MASFTHSLRACFSSGNTGTIMSCSIGHHCLRPDAGLGGAPSKSIDRLGATLVLVGKGRTTRTVHDQARAGGRALLVPSAVDRSYCDCLFALPQPFPH